MSELADQREIGAVPRLSTTPMLEGCQVKGVALCCPRCRTALHPEYRCVSCEIQFPVVDGCPVLINEESSVFKLDEIASFSFMGMNQKQSLWVRMLPKTDHNMTARENFTRLAELLQRDARILVLGAGNGGTDTRAIYEGHFAVVNTDVWRGQVVDVIADAHDVPFPDGSFDCVIAQAVLEHVADPVRCVSEIHRVLKSDGIVYAEIPFMQQVHGAEHDFCRFTFLGQRRLFRWFLPIKSGVAVGPGAALAWAWEYFWMAWVSQRGMLRKIVRSLSRLSICWAPLSDRFLNSRPGAYDGASGIYFMGRKALAPVSDRELIREFRGVR